MRVSNSEVLEGRDSMNTPEYSKDTVSLHFGKRPGSASVVNTVEPSSAFRYIDVKRIGDIQAVQGQWIITGFFKTLICLWGGGIKETFPF